MKRPERMTPGENLIMTVLVLILFGVMLLSAEGCSVVTNKDPQWEYPTDLIQGEKQ